MDSLIAIHISLEIYAVVHAIDGSCRFNKDMIKLKNEKQAL